MKKRPAFKQIIAIAGVVLLAAMYLSSLIFALIGNDLGRSLLKASFAATLVIPVLIYIILMFYKLSHRKDESDEVIYADDKDDMFNDNDK